MSTAVCSLESRNPTNAKLQQWTCWMILGNSACSVHMCLMMGNLCAILIRVAHEMSSTSHRCAKQASCTELMSILQICNTSCLWWLRAITLHSQLLLLPLRLDCLIRGDDLFPVTPKGKHLPSTKTLSACRRAVLLPVTVSRISTFPLRLTLEHFLHRSDIKLEHFLPCCVTCPVTSPG